MNIIEIFIFNFNFSYIIHSDHTFSPCLSSFQILSNFLPTQLSALSPTPLFQQN